MALQTKSEIFTSGMMSVELPLGRGRPSHTRKQSEVCLDTIKNQHLKFLGEHNWSISYSLLLTLLGCPSNFKWQGVLYVQAAWKSQSHSTETAPSEDHHHFKSWWTKIHHMQHRMQKVHVWRMCHVQGPPVSGQYNEKASGQLWIRSTRMSPMVEHTDYPRTTGGTTLKV